MAKITHVKSARQLYKTVPVLNPDGTQKTTPVLKADGTQKTTKTGKPVFMKVTVADKSQPLPPRTCEECRLPIEVGTSYKHVTPKSGPYGGTTRYRHATCSDWQPWDLSGALWARVAQIVHDAEAMEFTEDMEVEDMESVMDDAVTAIQELAEEKRESAQNIEDGFGHATTASEELNEVADELENWASSMESYDFPEKPAEVDEPGDEPDDEDTDEWRDWDQTRDDWDQYQSDLSEWVDAVIGVRDDLLSENPF